MIFYERPSEIEPFSVYKFVVIDDVTIVWQSTWGLSHVDVARGVTDGDLSKVQGAGSFSTSKDTVCRMRWASDSLRAAGCENYFCDAEISEKVLQDVGWEVQDVDGL